ncbi:uncharacterized protein MYCGRDRAFT_96081 [Zymoseptoria tritici IPO323]|uniref:RING-type domain-containing protein n=1 Tax=Zymoseptoria tritici (strain CBS 115943 / IPO323) TaxID=336722 RepID=F9XL86_ZYMTI|nr:uncharacterized protein MYCGRDRAFT_96081 [Zymoseptoria tritici IPO323]EGP84180.1 hypothetical protein MYCGRDRAFT_96081 [Zymoseptoria tritici IPO323]
MALHFIIIPHSDPTRAKHTQTQPGPLLVVLQIHHRLVAPLTEHIIHHAFTAQPPRRAPRRDMASIHCGFHNFYQIITSTTAHMLLAILAANYLPVIASLFLFQTIAVWELVSRTSTTARQTTPTLPTRDSFINALPSAARLLVQDDCTICKDGCQDPVILACGHIFCRACIDRWFDQGNNTCPLDFRVLFKKGLQGKKAVKRKMPLMLKVKICHMVNSVVFCMICTLRIAHLVAFGTASTNFHQSTTLHGTIDIRGEPQLCIILLSVWYAGVLMLRGVLIFSEWLVRLCRLRWLKGPGWWKGFDHAKRMPNAVFILYSAVPVGLWLLKEMLQMRASAYKAESCTASSQALMRPH